MEPTKTIRLTSGPGNLPQDEYAFPSYELEKWQLTEINLAIQEADKKDYISRKDFIKLVKKYGG
ncbi:hypothetical protein PHIN7_03700 [Polynucleobacter sp. HIN7]|nr:hypothetical protein PHIN7_03700 [Polynucleobacter sp. HIN7]